MIVSAISAASTEMPTSSDVRMYSTLFAAHLEAKPRALPSTRLVSNYSSPFLPSAAPTNEDDNQYEQNYPWRRRLLHETLWKSKVGARLLVMWGVSPADTGDRNNPESWSQLVLDDDFEPCRQDSQVYLREICVRFIANAFASQVEQDYVCPMNRFDAWLEEQSNLENQWILRVTHTRRSL